MNETLNIETADVYEAPLLAEAGDFADLTQGGGNSYTEGALVYFG
ncbi:MULTISPECIES: lasso RiPP family leader peptide-containing protein [unclassified Streptomyces]